MFFSQRDRERLETIDHRTTVLETKLPTIIAALHRHVKWCGKLQFLQLCLLIGVVGFLIKIVLKLG